MYTEIDRMEPLSNMLRTATTEARAKLAELKTLLSNLYGSVPLEGDGGNASSSSGGGSGRPAPPSAHPDVIDITSDDDDDESSAPPSASNRAVFRPITPASTG